MAIRPGPVPGIAAIHILEVGVGALGEQDGHAVLAAILGGPEEGAPTRVALLAVQIRPTRDQETDQVSVPTRSGQHEGGVTPSILGIRIGPCIQQAAGGGEMAVEGSLHEGRPMTAIHGVRGGSRGEQAIDGRKITALRQQHQGGVGRRGRLSLFRGRLGTGGENEQTPEDGA